jgi:TatD DNase family protein
MTSPLQFVDSHAHLDMMSEAPGGLPGVLERMHATNTRAISIGTNAKDWPKIIEIAKINPEILGFTVGVHPTEAKADWRENLAAMEKILAEELKKPTPCPLPAGGENINGAAPCDPAAVRGVLSKFCAVGEIGLDYFRLEENPQRNEIIDLQRKVFAAQLSIVKASNLPLIIHSRGWKLGDNSVFKELVETIDREKIDWSKIVFHCFAEGPEEIRELNARGARASFTGIITFKNGQRAREAMLAQSPELLMVETDAPFLSPEPRRGTPNEPSRVGLVAAKAAALFGEPLEAMAERLAKTTRNFFGRQN